MVLDYENINIMAKGKNVQELFGRIDSKILYERTGITLSNIHIYQSTENGNVAYVKGDINDKDMPIGFTMPIIWDSIGKAYLCDPLSEWKERYDKIDLHFDIIDDLDNLIEKIYGGKK